MKEEEIKSDGWNEIRDKKGRVVLYVGNSIKEIAQNVVDETFPL